MRKARPDRGRGRVPGLELRTSSGASTWRLRYRFGGLQRTINLGPMSTAAARAAALTVRTQAADARRYPDKIEDPWVVRDRERCERRRGKLTVLRAAAAWVRAHRRTWRPRYRREVVGQLRRHVLPEFGGRDVNSLTREEVAASQSALHKRHPTTANRVLATWRALYSWLHKVGQAGLGVTANPTEGLEKLTRERRRERVYTDAELRALTAATAGTDLGDLVSFLLHTGTRDSETRAMRWSDVEPSRRLWTVPATVSKTGEPHVVPLSEGALAVLRRRSPKRFVDDRVFPFSRPQKALSAVSKRLGFSLRLHDIRRTVRTRLPGLGVTPDVAERVLGHALAGVRSKYDHYDYTPQVAEALALWSEALAGLLAENTEGTARS